MSASGESESFLPLTTAQHELWVAQQLLADVPFNTSQYLDVVGPFDFDRFEAATRQAAIETRALLRFELDDDGHPRQSVESDQDYHLGHQDLRDDDDPLATAHAWMRDDHRRRIDILAGPLIRGAVLRVAQDRHLVYASVHHIVLDGYAAALMQQRVGELYNTMLDDDEAPVGAEPSVAALVEADRAYRESQRYERDRAFWADHVRGLPAPTTLSDGAAPAATHTLSCGGAVPADLATAIATAGGDLGTPGVLVGVFAAYLARMTDANEVTLSLPVTARTTAVLRRGGGTVASVVPLRFPVESSTTVADLIGQARSELGNALRRQRFRGEDIARLAQRPGTHHGFGPAVNIMSFRTGVDLGAASAELGVISTGPVDDLALNIYPADAGMQLILEGNPNRYRQSEVDGHYRRLVQLLEEAVGDPETNVHRLAVLDDEQSATLLPWRGAESVEPQTFAELITAAVEQNPDGVAVVYNGQSWTYREFDRWTSRLARALLRAGAGPEATVAVALERSAESVAAVWAVIKTGAAFVPIDPSVPRARMDYILDDCATTIGLTTSTLRDRLPTTMEWLDIGDSDLVADLPSDPLGADDLPRQLTPQNTAYLIYTSGSTGLPKGVLVTHGGVANLAAERRDRYKLRAESVVLHHASPGFDMAVGEMLCALAGAATLVVAPIDAPAGPNLAALMRRERVTNAIITPGVLATLRPDELPDLWVLGVGGEAIREDLVDAWALGRLMRNGYGPTEATDIATIGELVVGEPVTIGAPLRGFRALVLDTRLRPVAPGMPGELYIGGPALARGYHGRPDLTAARFVADPFADGERLYRTGDLVSITAGPDYALEYHGRIDFQIKVRGHRIEPGEVESAITSLRGIERAAVVAREDGRTGTCLVAYLVGTDIDLGAVRLALADTLPSYLRPSAFVIVDDLPLTANGKLDTAALPAPELNRSGGDEPMTDEERRIAAAFAEVLGLESVGLDETFFELGGTSLLAFALRDRLVEVLGANVDPRTIIDRPTVRELAAFEATADAEQRWIDQLTEDARLDPELRPTAGAISASNGDVLLTGATGFLGVHLLRELLDRTDATVHCLIRARDREAGLRRLAAILEQYLLRSDDLTGRVNLLVGDLSAPRLGLGGGEYADIAGRVGTIVHNGARVNHLETYDDLRAPNVGGTTEVLRLAMTDRIKAVHFVSSLSAVLGTETNGIVLEDDEIRATEVPRQGYIATKWVAEQLVRQAGERGLPVAIHRPGLITGATATGVVSPDDSLWTMVRAAAHLGVAPDPGPASVSLAPVDYVAGAIAALACAEPPVGGCYHLVNATPTPIADLLAGLTRLGYDVEIADVDEARQLLADRATGHDDLMRATLLIGNFANIDDVGTADVILDDENARAALAPLDLTCQPITPQAIDLCLSRFRGAGLLPAESQAPAH